MPPKKIKKRIEEYNSCLSDIFFLNQVIDLIEQYENYLLGQSYHLLGQAQMECIYILKDMIQYMKKASSISIIPTVDANKINYIAAFEGEVSRLSHERVVCF